MNIAVCYILQVLCFVLNPFSQAFGPIDGNCTQSAIGRAIVNDWLFKQQQEFDEGRPLGRLHTAYIPIRSFGTFDSQNSPRRNNDDAFHKSPCLVYFTPVGLHESSSYVTFGKRDRTIAGENVVYHARDKERFSSNIQHGKVIGLSNHRATWRPSPFFESIHTVQDYIAIYSCSDLCNMEALAARLMISSSFFFLLVFGNVLLSFPSPTISSHSFYFNFDLLDLYTSKGNSNSSVSGAS